jgi:hypothetical protein
MFKLIEYTTTDPATKGIGVAGRHTDGTWHLATLSIPIEDDPDTWIAANQAAIEAALPAGRTLDIADLSRHTEDNSLTNEVAPDLDDIADIYPDRHAARIFKAFALVLLDEINILRTSPPPMPTRTIAQLKTAMKNKLESLP